jgi:hypothetical protein
METSDPLISYGTEPGMVSAGSEPLRLLFVDIVELKAGEQVVRKF